MQYDVLVLGGDVDALVAATALARQGSKVKVLAEGPILGGRLAPRSFHPGFSAPAAHLGGGLSEKTVEALDLRRFGYAAPEDAGVTTFREGEGKPFHLPAGREAAVAAAQRLSQADGEGLARLYDLLETLSDFLRPLLGMTPLPFARPGWREALEPAWHAFRLRRLGADTLHELLRIAPQPLHEFAEDWVQSEVLQATLTAPGLHSGWGGPRSPGGVAPLLLWEASNPGPRLSRGGLLGANLLEALEGAAKRAGVLVRTDAPVESLVCEGREVLGVRLRGGEEFTAPCVLSALGPRRTLLDLIPARALDPTLRRRISPYRAKGSVAKVHLALSELPPLPEGSSAQTRFQVGGSLVALERAFDPAKYGECSEAPYLELVFPSATDPKLAPAGKHVASVLVHHAPYSLSEGWTEAAREGLLERVLSALEARLPGLKACVIASALRTPEDLEQEWGLEGGHLLGGEISLDQLFTNRPCPEASAYRTTLPGLYLCGPGTHPGAFATGLSGINAAGQLRRDLRGGRARARSKG